MHLVLYSNAYVSQFVSTLSKEYALLKYILQQ